MIDRRTLSGLLVALMALPVGTDAQSPSRSAMPSEPEADAGSVEFIGPDGLGPAPSPPIGPAWDVGLERSFWNVGEIDLVACDRGFALLGYVDERRGGQRYRPRALVWTSPDGVEWSRGGALRPRGDPIEDDWTVFDLVVFRGALWAVGGEDRHLVVWRSRDCGQSWRRLRDRPAFFVGRKAIKLNGIRAAATADTLLLLGVQAGERIPYRRWAWTLDDEKGWRRIRGGLDGVVDFGLVSDGGRFLASREVVVPDVRSEGQLITSEDGRRWDELGVLPDDDRPVIPDPTRDRLLVQTDVVGTGWTSPEIQASAGDEAWTSLVRAAPATQASSSQLFESDGALVWIIDIWDDTDTNAWSWIGVSEDGGATWTVSAGQSGMQLAGLQSVAASDDAIVLAFTGEGFDGIRAWALPRRQAKTTGAPPTPAGEGAVERPTLHEPMALPKGRRPVLAIGRAPDATVNRRGVRLDLWVRRRAIRTGRWMPATLRVTNLSGRPILHYGQAGCDNGNVQLRFDFADLFDAGNGWSGKAARFKRVFLKDSGLVSSWMTTVRPVRTDCLGSVGTWEILASGRSFTVSDVAFVRYPWASQPLPSGKAKVTACYRFEFPRAGDEGRALDRHYDQCLSAPVRIKGRKVDYPSPQELTDAMLADPTFRTWVEDRRPHALFHTDVDGPWRKRGYDSWANDGYAGGPAPAELIRISSQAGGRNGDRVQDLIIDAWTAEVLETTIVSGVLKPPEGVYPTPSPSPTP